jgi:hypothetical protein
MYVNQQIWLEASSHLLSSQKKIVIFVHARHPVERVNLEPVPPWSLVFEFGKIQHLKVSNNFETNTYMQSIITSIHAPKISAKCITPSVLKKMSQICAKLDICRH